MTRFLAFRYSRALLGKYKQEAFPKSDVRAFLHGDGEEGFWSLVRGKHAVLIVMQVVDTTVSDDNMPSNKNRPEVVIGDEILVVIPEEGVTLWADSSVDDLAAGGGLQLPLPECRFEKWKRIS